MNTTRRDFLTGATAALGTALAPSLSLAAEAEKRPANEPFGYCLNTSTIQGKKLTIVDKIEIAAKVGFQAVEPWIRELDEYVKTGGDLKELGKRIRLNGLKVESAIGFFEWIVDDDDKRKKALEEAKRNMDMVRQIGGLRLAAPPKGATDVGNIDLRKAAERYRALLDLGDTMGVVPQVELWGFSKTLSRLGEVAYVVLESGHAKACMLLDIYHLYKGGSGYDGLKMLNGAGLHVIHANDYPDKPRAEITDAQRVYPGDGVTPWKTLLRTLRDIGFRGYLSLELFNRDYWKQDPLLVARTGLEKMRGVVQKSLAD